MPLRLDGACKVMRRRDRVDLRGAGVLLRGRTGAYYDVGSCLAPSPLRAPWSRQPERLCHQALFGTRASVVDGDPSRPGNRGHGGRVWQVWARLRVRVKGEPSNPDGLRGSPRCCS